MKPMLAGKFEIGRQRYPVFVQPKFDGIRCLVIDGVPHTRTLKLVPNIYIQQWFKANVEHLNKLDGELIVGNPTDPDVYRRTASGVMSSSGTPPFTYYVFDAVLPLTSYCYRLEELKLRETRMVQSDNIGLISHITFVKSFLAKNEDDMFAEESDLVNAGYEGAILRCPNSQYKFGRSTTVGGELLKLKRFVDDEAKIIGFEELYSNQNEATIDALGHTKRSSHQAGKVAAGTLGALIVVNAAGQQFNVGSGFDQALRREIWDNKATYEGKMITYKYVMVGGYDVPRFPIFKGFRHPEDMSP